MRDEPVVVDAELALDPAVLVDLGVESSVLERRQLARGPFEINHRARLCRLVVTKGMVRQTERRCRAARWRALPLRRSRTVAAAMRAARWRNDQRVTRVLELYRPHPRDECNARSPRLRSALAWNGAARSSRALRSAGSSWEARSYHAAAAAGSAAADSRVKEPRATPSDLR